MKRRSARRGLAYGAIAVLAHLALLGAMGLGLLQAERPAAPLVVDLDLTPVRPWRTEPVAHKPDARIPTRAPPVVAANRPDRAPPAPSASPTAAAPAAPSAPAIGSRTVQTGAPMGPEAPTQAALKGSSGCDSATYVGLKPAEAARCEARDARLRAKTHATYAVIDPEKKDFFDGACRRDDAWCLYRTGQGPYPGLLALVRKKR
jgi:hypothetical protein